MGRRAFFVAISLALAAAAWPAQLPDATAAVPSVPLRLPYDADEQVRWTGGPHVYYCSRNCLLPIGDDTLNLYRTGEGSGLDFSSGGNFDVLAMAAGHVIYATGQAADDPERVACSTSGGFGCRIAIQAADGTVIVYAHLLDGSVLVHAGDDPEQGRILAKAGRSGGQSYDHLHIDWRDGTGSWPDGSDGSCGGTGTNCLYGNPIGWDGHPLGLDGYRIWPFLCTDSAVDAAYATAPGATPRPRCSGDGDVAFDYDGSATKGDVTTIADCGFSDGLGGTTRRNATVAVDATYRGTTCDTSDPGTPTQFAGRGAIGAGAGDVTTVAGTVDPGGGYLISTNRRTPGGPTAPSVQWIEPVDGAKVGPSLRLAAWPTPVLVDGQLTDPSDISRVEFTASWSGGSSFACRAKAAGSDGRWSCTADLEEMGVPAGPFELSFDVLRTDGSALSAPDGVETVTYVRPPTDPMKYLRAGIPKAVRPTCRQASGTLPPATIAALDCKPDAKAIDTITYFLMRPADARATWQERMAEYGLKAGGNCAKGKAGIQSNKRALSIGCYKNEPGYANLRLASSKVCPAVYVGVLGNTQDIATLWKAYQRVAGEGWTDPGFGGRQDAPGCSGRLPAYAPPGPPEDVVATTNDVTTGLDAGMRRACQAAGIALKYPGKYGGAKCAVTDIRWSPAAGRVDRYIIRLLIQVVGADGSGYRDRKILATLGPSVRSYRYVTMHGYSTGAAVRYRIVVEAANAAGGSTAVARWPRSWVP